VRLFHPGKVFVLFRHYRRLSTVMRFRYRAGCPCTEGLVLFPFDDSTLNDVNFSASRFFTDKESCINLPAVDITLPAAVGFTTEVKIIVHESGAVKSM